MNTPRTVEIQAPSGAVLTVSLSSEDGREAATLLIDGVPYHWERLRREELLADYAVDGDPDYAPQSDSDGFCYLLAPYSR